MHGKILSSREIRAFGNIALSFGKESRLRVLLARFPFLRLSDLSGLRGAAGILPPLFRHDDALACLFFIRAWLRLFHSGDAAFRTFFIIRLQKIRFPDCGGNRGFCPRIFRPRRILAGVWRVRFALLFWNRFRRHRLFALSLHSKVGFKSLFRPRLQAFLLLFALVARRAGWNVPFDLRGAEPDSGQRRILHLRMLRGLLLSGGRGQLLRLPSFLQAERGFFGQGFQNHHALHSASGIRRPAFDSLRLSRQGTCFTQASERANQLVRLLRFMLLHRLLFYPSGVREPSSRARLLPFWSVRLHSPNLRADSGIFHSGGCLRIHGLQVFEPALHNFFGSGNRAHVRQKRPLLQIFASASCGFDSLRFGLSIQSHRHGAQKPVRADARRA